MVRGVEGSHPQVGGQVEIVSMRDLLVHSRNFVFDSADDDKISPLFLAQLDHCFVATSVVPVVMRC